MPVATQLDGGAYLHDADGKIARNNNGECVRTVSWTADDRKACDPEILIRPRATFSYWPAPYREEIPAESVTSVPATAGTANPLMEYIESLVEPVAPRSTVAASQTDSESILPEGEAAAEPVGKIATTPSLESAATASGPAAIPPGGSKPAVDPKWMKEAKKGKTPPPKPKYTPPSKMYAAMFAAILNALAILAHAW